MKRKKPKVGRPRKATHAPRFAVSVSREKYREIQGIAIARGVTQAAVVEMVTAGVGVECAGGDCPDCCAESAGV